MNIGYTKGLTLLLLVRMLSACHSEGKEIEENAIRFESVVVEKTYPVENKKDTTTEGRVLKIHFTYPTEYANRGGLRLCNSNSSGACWAIRMRNCQSRRR